MVLVDLASKPKRTIMSCAFAMVATEQKVSKAAQQCEQKLSGMFTTYLYFKQNWSKLALQHPKTFKAPQAMNDADW